MDIGWRENGRSSGTLPFVLTLFTLIAISLLSALIPLGPPASKVMGSAFSPATTSVAIKARSAQPTIVVRAVVPPPFEPPVSRLIQALLTGLVLLGLIRREQPRGVIQIPSHFLLLKRRMARGPPLHRI
jgi:hypothetical protein